MRILSGIRKCEQRIPGYHLIYIEVGAFVVTVNWIRRICANFFYIKNT